MAVFDLRTFTLSASVMDGKFILHTTAGMIYLSWCTVLLTHSC